jgi:hypothetical protein
MKNEEKRGKQGEIAEKTEGKKEIEVKRVNYINAKREEIKPKRVCEVYILVYRGRGKILS